MLTRRFYLFLFSYFGNSPAGIRSSIARKHTFPSGWETLETDGNFVLFPIRTMEARMIGAMKFERISAPGEIYTEVEL